jgi:hypothetical protein
MQEIALDECPDLDFRRRFATSAGRSQGKGGGARSASIDA